MPRSLNQYMLKEKGIHLSYLHH